MNDEYFKNAIHELQEARKKQIIAEFEPLLEEWVKITQKILDKMEEIQGDPEIMVNHCLGTTFCHFKKPTWIDLERMETAAKYGHKPFAWKISIPPIE